jgi:hypothetical protein
MPHVFKSLQSERVYLGLVTKRLDDLWHICMGLFYPSKQVPVEGDANYKDFNDVFVRKRRPWLKYGYGTPPSNV